MLRLLLLAALAAALAACVTSPAPLPPDGPILYTCADGTQLTATFAGNVARVAIVGGVSMSLPNTSTGPDVPPFYSNGRYGLRGRGERTSWEVAGRAPSACRGR
jgi:hypothetical protein